MLLSGVGSLVGTNVLESLQWLGRDRFCVIGINSVADAANNFVCDACFLVPPVVDEAGYQSALSAVVDEMRPDLVIPCRDDDVVAVARWAATSGVPALVGGAAIAEMMRDKWLTCQWAARHGLPFAESAVTPEAAHALHARWGMPMIAKPRKGDGSRGVRVLTRASQLDAVLAMPGMVIQPLLTPPEDLSPWLEDGRAGVPLWSAPPDRGHYSVQALVRPDGSAEVMAAAINVMVCGIAQHTRLERDPALVAVGLAYAQALAADGWRGPVMVQCRRLVDGQYVPFEIGGRFSGGTGLRDVLGVGEVARVLSAFLPGVVLDDARSGEVGDVALRCPQSVVLRAQQVSTLQATGRWQAFG